MPNGCPITQIWPKLRGIAQIWVNPQIWVTTEREITLGSPKIGRVAYFWGWSSTWAPSQYPKRRLSVRSRQVSKPRDLYLELFDRFEIWQALRQQCCRCACQISKRNDNLKYQSRGFETLRDLTKRRLFGYWDGALVSSWWLILSISMQHEHWPKYCNTGHDAPSKQFAQYHISQINYYPNERGYRKSYILTNRCNEFKFHKF